MILTRNMNIAQKILFIFTLVSSTLYGQTYNIATNNGQTINTCSGRFYDSGGSGSNFANGENYSMTFCSSNGQNLTFDFSHTASSDLNFDSATGDTLFFYDASTGALIATLSQQDDVSFSQVKVATLSTCVLVRFKSNGSGVDGGWDAVIACEPSPTCLTNPPAADIFLQAPLVCNLSSYCGNTDTFYGEDLPFNLEGGGNCPTPTDNIFGGTIENNSWIKFIASATTATFNFNVPCGIDGIQVAILDYNPAAATNKFSLKSPCNLTDGSHGGNFSVTGTALTIGKTYYLMIDGDAGAICNYSFTASSGVTTVSAGADKNICPGNSTSFTANGPAGATYTWKDLSGNVIGTGLTYNTPILNANTSYIVEVTNGPCLTSKDTVQALIVCALPVELIDFNGSCISNKVDLNWQTASERNNSYFSIYRAGANGNYQLIGVVNGNGNSTTLSNYQYIDNDPFVGINYYKITQTDFNGATDELKTISVWHDCSNIRHSNIDTYYNSETNQIVFGYDFDKDENITIELVDAVGNIVYSNQMYLEKNLNKASVSLDKSLATGVYLVRCSNAHFTFTGKVYLNK